MAKLYQRKGRYYVDYSLNGRRVRKVIGVDRSKAELYLTEIEYRLFKGDLTPQRPELPVEYAISRFLTNCQMRIAPSTCTRYKHSLTHFQKYILTHHPINHIGQLNKPMIIEYSAYRLTNKPKPKRKTINNELAVIRVLLNFAVDSGYIETNPASKVKMLQETDSKKGQIYKPEDIDLILSVSDTWFGDVILVFLLTGMRLGELTHLTWNDVNLEEGTITIQEKEGWSPKSYSRTIPMNKKVREIITHQPHHHYVFTHKQNKIPNNYLRKRLIKYSKMVGLNYSRIHDLRHTFCSNLLMRGVDVPTVSSLLGHRSWSTTLIYSHQSDEHKRKAVKVLE